MERKNTILLTVIAIATLLVAVVGATFAYFTASIQDERNGDANNGSTNIQAGQVAGSTVVANIEGAAGSFTATDVWPGHKEVAALQVSATGATAGSKSVVNFKYNVTTNDLGAGNVKVYLYRSTTKIATTEDYFECAKQTQTVGSEVQNYETCTEKSVGTMIGQATTLSGGAQTVSLGQDTITTTTANTAETVYYYVVVEFVNQNSSQNEVMGKSLVGQVTVEPAA